MTSYLLPECGRVTGGGLPVCEPKKPAAGPLVAGRPLTHGSAVALSRLFDAAFDVSGVLLLFVFIGDDVANGAMAMGCGKTGCWLFSTWLFRFCAVAWATCAALATCADSANWLATWLAIWLACACIC